MTEESKKPTEGADAALETDRRSFMKTASLLGAGAVAGALHGKFGTAPLVSEAQAQTPTQAAWWPSRWGADDEAGASNWITPAKVLDAVQSIRDGKIYRIGRVYEPGMPLFGTRAFTLRIPGAPTGGPFGTNKLVYNDEFLATEIGQVGTQFDGLGHIGVQLGRDGDKNDMRFYNGITVQQMQPDGNGLKKLGIEKLKPLFTRGHLMNMVAVKGGMMDAGQEISVADIRAALARQNTPETEIKQGDAIFFHTGWGSLWMKNNDRYNAGCPGIGVEATRWIIDKGLCVVGADTWPVEVVPNPDANLAFVCHAELIAKNGIFIHENMVFDELVADGKTRFVYIFTPSPIKGATGANGSPIAIT
jgi:kynurenine formamidase